MKLLAAIKILRMHQWIKNLMLFFPPFLGGALVQPDILCKGFVPFIAFSLASSAGYITNDLLDRNSDITHPRKSKRPIASGSISVKAAQLLIITLVVSAVAVGISVSKTFAMFILAYLVVSVAYSCCLKNLPVVDLFCIATGFLFRLLAGGVVFEIRVSEWLFLSVLLLSLFLSAGKRLSEKLVLDADAALHRKVLGQYPDGFLDGVLIMTASAVLVTYTMYTLTYRTLLYTVPLCCFGLMRYILRVKQGDSGDPTEALLKDPWLLVVGVFWVALVSWSIYI